MSKRVLFRVFPIFAVAAVAAVAVYAAGTGRSFAQEPTATTPNFKVAFLGDQGLNADAVAVLQLVQSEGADMVLHQGDFGYNEADSQTPTNWENQINSILGANFPYFGSVGNHDVGHWAQYQQLLQDRLDR